MNRLVQGCQWFERPSSPTAQSDKDIFFVPDKKVRGHPCKICPSSSDAASAVYQVTRFKLQDRLALRSTRVRRQGQVPPGSSDKLYNPPTGAIADAMKGLFVLDSMGSSKKWRQELKTFGLDVVVGRPNTELEFVRALKSWDLLVYVFFFFLSPFF
ncbi:hypothetical protein CPC08DRAFT_562581 [Agrocybe pediades]|nr:hypothetical protein CPC08DRAFT_562581 [Agrocybe pediades]